MKKFWKWKNQAETETAPAERTLFLNGTIAEESWFDDDVTPQLFKEELMGGSGDITAMTENMKVVKSSMQTPPSCWKESTAYSLYLIQMEMSMEQEG